MPELYAESVRTARKEHRCEACGRSVTRAQRYVSVSGIWDGRLDRMAMHVRCHAVYVALAAKMDPWEVDEFYFQNTLDALHQHNYDRNRDRPINRRCAPAKEDQ